jgi:hypothetical protein
MISNLSCSYAGLIASMMIVILAPSSRPLRKTWGGKEPPRSGGSGEAKLGTLAGQSRDTELAHHQPVTKRISLRPSVAIGPFISGIGNAIMQTSSNERHLQAIEDDIRLGKSLIGRITALAAIGPARGKTHRAGEVRRMLATAEELLAPLYVLRSQLLIDLASQR